MYQEDAQKGSVRHHTSGWEQHLLVTLDQRPAIAPQYRLMIGEKSEHFISQKHIEYAFVAVALWVQKKP